jgi:peptide/nickel transport system substrate-binding protein
LPIPPLPLRTVGCPGPRRRTVGHPTPRRRAIAQALTALLALALAATLATLSATHVAAQASPSAPLTITMGPRQAAWKRVFNPFLNEADTRWPTAAGIHEPLIVYNRATGTYMPWLATSFQWSAENTKVRFPLRTGVLWSDGTPFSARDVVFTFEQMRRVPALDTTRMWQFLASVAALDAATVEFTFKRTFTPGLAYIGNQPIVAEHKWKDVAQPASFDDPNPVGTGPFTEVRRFEPAVYELGRNPKYWQSGKPAASALRVPLFRTNDEIVRALGAGELDWASLFLPDIEGSWVSKNPSRHQYWYPDLGPTVLLNLNTRRKPFDDPDVRKAISMAVDRPRIMAQSMNGYAPPADVTGLAESQKRWKDAALLGSATWTKRDVALANRLLDAAGLARSADGTRVAVGGSAMRYDLNVVQGWTDWVTAAGIIRENLAEVGVDVTVKQLGYGAWVDGLRLGRFDMGIWFGSRGSTPYQFYRGQMDGALVRPVGEEAEDNFHRFASDEAGRLLRRFEASADVDELAAIGRELQRLFIENAPSVPLFASPLWGVFSTERFSGFPSRLNPYASAAPGGADSLPVLVQVTPR